MKEARLGHSGSRYLAYGLLILGFGLILFAAVLVFRGHSIQPKPPRGAVEAAVKSSVKPTPQAIASYTVPLSDPKYITIPKSRVSQARVVRLGLLGNGQIAVPNNIYDAGWYDGSAKPGQAGAMFMYGHVSSWTADGIFYNLKKLTRGDQISITRGDNTTYTYVVVSTAIYPYTSVDMTKVLAPIDSNAPGLNLMTCTGKVISGTSDFSERLVVFARLATN